MEITLEKISDILKEKDKFYILTHQYPDGDTLGSACALALALQRQDIDFKNGYIKINKTLTKTKK